GLVGVITDHSAFPNRVTILFIGSQLAMMVSDLASEVELQAELQFAHIGWGRRNLPETRTRKVRVRQAPIGMVRQIERFEAEFQVAALRDRKQFQSGKIPTDNAWANQCVAAGVAVTDETMQKK